MITKKKKIFESGIEWGDIDATTSNLRRQLRDADLPNQQFLTMEYQNTKHVIPVASLYRIMGEAVDYIRKHIQPLRCFCDRPLVLSLKLSTAMTNGTMFAFNPFFLYILYLRGLHQYMSTTREEYTAQTQEEQDFYDGVTNVLPQTLATRGLELDHINNRSVKFVVYVLVHEYYHVFHKHFSREKWFFSHKDTNGNYPTKEYTYRLNTLMDLEINRDLEKDIPDLKGCTNIIGGMDYMGLQTIQLKSGKEKTVPRFPYVTKDPNGKALVNNFHDQLWEEMYAYYAENSGLYPDGNQPQTPPPPPQKIDEPKTETKPRISDGYREGWAVAREILKKKH